MADVVIRGDTAHLDSAPAVVLQCETRPAGDGVAVSRRLP
jgi:hypothetical protein